jgi:hypothetical protein
MTTLCATAVEATPSPVERRDLAVRVCEHASLRSLDGRAVEGVELHLRSRVVSCVPATPRGPRLVSGPLATAATRIGAGEPVPVEAGVGLSTASRQHDYRQQADQLPHFRSFVCE